MITNNSEYISKLYAIQDQNPPTLALLPKAEPVYNVNVGTRLVEAPQFLGLTKDHASETIYFQVDRYVDYMDLANTACIIQYVNAKGEAHIYAVPFYDTTTKAAEGKIVFPWHIDATVVAQKGIVEFSIRFYIINSKDDNLYYAYSLNTLTSCSEVLETLEVQELTNDYNLEADKYNYLLGEIQKFKKPVLYWRTLY